ncbi:hypothetical protein BGX38DRAFT_1210623 [Terfezia claveryi]|nr:hypothetical protein BGX38DRAFT_1210623 [Terfezia claveryi]
MKVTCQVVTTPSADTSGTSILLSLEAKKYLLGSLHEGIQRALLQRKVKTVRICDFFLTGKTEWKNIGGLLGMLLTVADQETARKADHQTKIEEAIERNRAFAEGRGGGGTAPTIPEPFEKKSLTIHGNENLMHAIGTTRSFVFRTSMNTNFNEITEDFVDEFLKVHPMKIYPDGYVQNAMDASALADSSGTSFNGGRKRSCNGELIALRTREEVLKSVVRDMFNSAWTMDTLMPEDELPPNEDAPVPDANAPPALPALPKMVRAPWPAAMVRRLPQSKPSAASLSYFVILHPQRGRFLPQIAKELGVTPGPQFRELTEGRSVTTPDGRVVIPEECMEPQKPGKNILVLDIPDRSYVGPLLARDELQDEGLEATVFWLLGPEVVKDERLWEKMQKWTKSTNVVSSPDICPNSITFVGAAKAATKLNLLHPDHFPIPICENEPKMAVPEGLTNLILAKPQQQLSILPKFELQQLPIPMTLEDGRFDIEGVRAASEPEYIKLAKEARENVEKADIPEGLEEFPGKEVEIIPLGTGSAMPSKYRNVSATLLRVPGAGSILFDCGEATLGQLARLYGQEKLPDVLRDIKCIYISHLHADHHLGTAAVLKAIYQVKHNGKSVPPTPSETAIPGPDVSMTDADLTPTVSFLLDTPDDIMWVIGLGKYDGLLKEYADVEDIGYSWIRYIATEEIRTGQGNTLRYLEPFYKALSISKIQTAKANHCIGASTCAFTWNDGFKFAYSGDTRPTQDFVRIGQGATLVLHEATFDDELRGEAVAKKHSTTSEAIKAGMDMGAKALMLTHFSQRYPKLPVIAEEGHGKQKMKVALAFDMMKIKVGEFWRFEKFIPALRELYKDEADEEDALVAVEDDAKPEKTPKAQGKKNEKKRKREEARAKNNRSGDDQRNSKGRRGGRERVVEGSKQQPEELLPTEEVIALSEAATQSIPKGLTSLKPVLPGYF